MVKPSWQNFIPTLRKTVVKFIYSFPQTTAN